MEEMAPPLCNESISNIAPPIVAMVPKVSSLKWTPGLWTPSQLLNPGHWTGRGSVRQVYLIQCPPWQKLLREKVNEHGPKPVSQNNHSGLDHMKIHVDPRWLHAWAANWGKGLKESGEGRREFQILLF